MADIENEAVTVGTSRAVITSARGGRQDIIIQNLSSNDIFIGGSTVTTANGLKVPANAIYNYTLPSGVSLWAIAGSNSTGVRVNRLALSR